MAGQTSGAKAGELLDGLILRGVIEGRRRKEFPNQTTGEVRTCVTYSVLCNGHTIRLDAWGASEFFPVGDRIEVNVGVRAYKNKAGVALYSLSVFGGDEPGEAF